MRAEQVLRAKAEELAGARQRESDLYCQRNGQLQHAKAEQVTRGKGLANPQVATEVQYWQPLSHRELLSTWNVTSVAEELNFKFYLVSIYFK